MSKHSDDLRTLVNQITEEAFVAAHGYVNPTEFAMEVYESLTEAQRSEIEKHEGQALLALFVSVSKNRWKAKAPQDQLEMWDSDRPIPSHIDGCSIKNGESVWPDQLVRREQQITNLRRANRTFDEEESFRDDLREAGMADDPTMTVDDVKKNRQE